MRVLMVSSLWPPEALGGAEIYAHALACHLERQGHDVAVVSSVTGDPRILERIRPWPYSLRDHAGQDRLRRLGFHLRDQFDPSADRHVGRAIERFRPDVVHTHSVAGFSALALVAPRRRHVAHVHTIHDYWLLCQRSTLVRASGERCERRCTSCGWISAGRLALLRHRPADVVIAVSHAVADEHRRHADLGDVRVVRNPAPAPRPRPARASDGPLRFGYLGQLIREKGVRTLLRAARGRPPGSEVMVAGRGPLGDEVAASPDVRAVGWLGGADKDGFFDGLDCLVVPSEWKDPAPTVIDEARSMGIPVIGAAIGGIPELVPEPCRALLFPPGDAGALAASMGRFAEDPSRFAPVPATDEWPTHVAAIARAYTDARAVAGS